MIFRAGEIYEFTRFPAAIFITADWSSHFWSDFRSHDSQRQKFKFCFENLCLIVLNCCNIFLSNNAFKRSFEVTEGQNLINLDRRCFEPNFSFSSSVAWFVQTFIFGFPSMNLLAAYAPPGSKPVRSHAYYKFVPLSGIIVNGLKISKFEICNILSCLFRSLLS